MTYKYDPRPGPQNPGKYNHVGPNYQRYGEQTQNGYYYWPATDTYYVDPKAAQKQLQDQGVLDKPKGLLEQVAPMAGAAGAVYAGKKAGEALLEGTKEDPSLLREGYNYVTGANKAAPAAGTSASSAVNPNVVAELNKTPSGLLAGGAEATTSGIGPVASGEQYAASLGEASPPGGLFSVGSTAGNIAGGAGVALGGYEAYQGIKDKNPVQAGLGGAGVVLGLNQLGYALGPWGVAASIAVPVVASLVNKMTDKDRWKEEGDNLRRLSESGVYIPQPLLDNAAKITGGRSKEELVQLAKETGGNVKFAESRDEKDLTGVDIIGFSTMFEHDPEWGHRPQDQQIAYAQSLLDKGLVREAKGQIKVQWDKAPPPPWTEQSKTQQQPKGLMAGA